MTAPRSQSPRKAIAATVSPQQRLLALLAALVFALAAATGVDAAIVTAQDDQGRTITFDVRDQTADVQWYATLLRAAAHGDEISTVTIRIVRPEEVATFCGNQAAACYSRSRTRPLIVVPSGRGSFVASTMLHEYGHHLDAARRVPGVPELNGTPSWWAARDMAAHVAAGRAAFDYSLGWSRSVAEVFAEDYAFIHIGIGYAIPWLTPPDETLKAAMVADIGAPTSTLPPDATTPAPLVIARSGTLAARARRDVPFGLLGPGRRVTLTATVSNPRRAGTRARAQIICNDRTLATQAFVRGRAQRTIDLPNQGPGECVARMVNTTGIRLSYTLRLRLEIENAS